MDFELKELGITFIVGSFMILGLEAILYYFFNIQFTGFFQSGLRLTQRTRATGKSDAKINSSEEDESENSKRNEVEFSPQTVKILIFIGMAFGIGVIAEDLSYKYVDSVQTPFKELPSVVSALLPNELDKSLGLPSKENSRIKTLIKNFHEKPQTELLAEDLAKQKAFSLLNPETGPKIEGWIINPNRCTPAKESFEGCPSSAEITSSIYSLYYYAKNVVYLKQSYYDEMKKIESRRDFSRSISLIAFVYFTAALLLGLTRVIFLLIRYKPGEFRTNQVRIIFKKALFICLVLFGIYFFSMWAYERESDEFNKRAFGYFSTMLMAKNNGEDTKAPNCREDTKAQTEEK
jgi:hypothetical protein